MKDAVTTPSQEPARPISTGFARGLWVLGFFVLGFIFFPVEYKIVWLFVPSLNNKDDALGLLLLFFLFGLLTFTMLGFVLSFRGILPGTRTPKSVHPAPTCCSHRQAG
jgi:hypothetical protein